jgi:hypothetical protein
MGYFVFRVHIIRKQILSTFAESENKSYFDFPFKLDDSHILVIKYYRKAVACYNFYQFIGVKIFA